MHTPQPTNTLTLEPVKPRSMVLSWMAISGAFGAALGAPLEQTGSGLAIGIAAGGVISLALRELRGYRA